MKYKLQIFLLLLTLFTSLSTSINAAFAQQINENTLCTAICSVFWKITPSIDVAFASSLVKY